MRTDDILGIAHLLKSGTDSLFLWGFCKDFSGQEMRKPGSEEGPAWIMPPSFPWETVVFYSPSTIPSFATDQSTMEGPTFPGAIKAGWACGQPPLVLGTQGKCINFDCDQIEFYSNQLWASIIMSSLCILLGRVHCLAVIKVLTGEI